MKVNKTDKIKRRDAIIYKIAKQISSDNDKWYAKYNRDSDTYYVGKEDKKKLLSQKAVMKKLKIEEKEKEKVQIIRMKLMKSSQKNK